MNAQEKRTHPRIELEEPERDGFMREVFPCCRFTADRVAAKSVATRPSPARRDRLFPLFQPPGRSHGMSVEFDPLCCE